MAFYEYVCEDCGSTFTVSQLISQHDRLKKPPKCPQCESHNTHQLLTSFFAKTKSKT
jgi:putative FmdB family regulatory protein